MTKRRRKSVQSMDGPAGRGTVVARLVEYGGAAHARRLYSSAEVAYRRALALAPREAEAWNGLGATLHERGELDGALRALSQAVKFNPKSESAWGNRGLVHAAKGEAAKARRDFTRSLSLRPDNLGARWNLANILLSSGDWEAGLREYEVRIQHRGPPNFPRMPFPMWEGQDLNGKIIFIQAEQGIGDQLLGLRYLPRLKRRYPKARIVFLVKSQMHPLIWPLRDYVEFVPEGLPWMKADYGLFEMSLPRLLGTTAEEVPADPGLIRDYVLPHKGSCNLPEPHEPTLKVGVCWSGNPRMDRNAERSIPLEQLLGLMDDPRITLYSLQVGPAAGDVDRLQAQELLVTHHIPDMAGNLFYTAVTMLNLDVVVTACTSIAHLAGVLQVPALVMLCHNPYWVWMRDRGDTPWYPSLRLLRQLTPGDWGPVIVEVRGRLERLMPTAIRQRVA